MADGCPGQNKNSTMLAMCSFWLLNKSPDHVKSIELIFPQTGHSYIPPDKVFGQIERKVRKCKQIDISEEYVDIYKKIGKTFNLGCEIPVYDFKNKADHCFKKQWHFQIKSSVKVFITKKNNSIFFRGEKNYRNEAGYDALILKRGGRISTSVGDQLSNGIPIKSSKINDINKLLTKHYGKYWQNISKLGFYVQLLKESDVNYEVPDYDGYDEEAIEEDISLQV